MNREGYSVSFLYVWHRFRHYPSVLSRRQAAGPESVNSNGRSEQKHRLCSIPLPLIHHTYWTRLQLSADTNGLFGTHKFVTHKSGLRPLKAQPCGVYQKLTLSPWRLPLVCGLQFWSLEYGILNIAILIPYSIKKLTIHFDELYTLSKDGL